MRALYIREDALAKFVTCESGIRVNMRHVTTYGSDTAPNVFGLPADTVTGRGRGSKTGSLKLSLEGQATHLRAACREVLLM